MMRWWPCTNAELIVQVEEVKYPQNHLRLIGTLEKRVFNLKEQAFWALKASIIIEILTGPFLPQDIRNTVFPGHEWTLAVGFDE